MQRPHLIDIDLALLIDRFMGYTHPIGSCMYREWNDIMPVVEKIESIHDPHHGYFAVHISSNSCMIQGTNLHRSLEDSTYGAVYMSDPNAILDTKKDSTLWNIVDFIKWYEEDEQLHKSPNNEP